MYFSHDKTHRTIYHTYMCLRNIEVLKQSTCNCSYSYMLILIAYCTTVEGGDKYPVAFLMYICRFGYGGAMAKKKNSRKLGGRKFINNDLTILTYKRT